MFEFDGAPTVVSDPLGLSATGKNHTSDDPSVKSPGRKRTPKKERTPGPVIDGRETIIDSRGRPQFKDGGGVARNPDSPKAPTHRAKTDPYGPAQGKHIQLPGDTPVTVKMGKKPNETYVNKTADEAAADRHAERGKARTHRTTEEQKRAEAKAARKQGDAERAKQLDAEADEHKKAKEYHDQKARENSEALGDAATDHAVKQMFAPDKTVTPVAKDRGPNTFDNTYKIDPPPPDYVIAESKGGSGKNKSSREGDNTGERYEQGTPEYRNQLLRKQEKDPNTSAEQQILARDVRSGDAS